MMKNLRIVITIFLLHFFLILQLPINAQAQVTPSDQSRALRDLQQSQQKQENFLKNLEDEQEREIREKKKPKIEVPVLEGQEAVPEEEVTKGKKGKHKKKAPCFDIKTIELKGATILKGKELDKITKPYSGTCMGIAEINELMHKVTNFYVDKGYVTTRVAVPQQDLKSGNLQIMVMEGTVEDIILNENTWRDKAQVAMAFPFMKGKVLNLRDIEQGLDQLNRLASSTATMQLVPGDKQGGTKIVISNKLNKQNRASLGYDNSGQSSTGKNKGTASIERDNLLGLGEAWSFNINEDTAPNRGTKSSEVYSGNFSLPFGYWTFSENASHSEYLQTITGTNQSFQASGQTDSSTSKLERVIYRNQDSKVSLNTGLKLKDTKAFIIDTPSTSGTYTLSIWTAGVDYTLRALNAVWGFASGYERGIDAFGARNDASAITNDSPHAQFDKYTMDASVYKPFQVKTANLAWRSSISGQYSNDTLFSSERISIGDRYSVHGFAESSLLGDSGIYNRNELMWNLPQFTENKYANFLVGNLQPYVGLDAGTARAAIGKHGMSRIAGNVIWSLPLQEHATTTTQSAGGGKGGGGSVTQSTTTYSYTASFAVAICEGPITSLVRVWADSKQLDLTQGDYTLYLGDEEQLPDTFISSFYPAGQTPAYRGTAYVVVKDFPLADFGNRIPNFSFEVKRVVRMPGDLEDKITDITLIPGAGEYVYDTVVQQKTVGEFDRLGHFLQAGQASKINQHNLSSKADVLVALDDLKANLPNIQWISVVVNWFADTQNPASISIKPGVEFDGRGVKVEPDIWSVAGYTRLTAHQILYFDNGSPTFGGTPTDISIIRLCQELKTRGYNIMFYPQLQVDTITPNSKPWRGRIIPTSSGDVTNFFTGGEGYNAFIIHYANLQVDGVYLKNCIDAFMLGSELVGMTQYASSTGVFPAVTQLKNLAASTKSAVGSVKVTYGADWSEYHSVGGWYNLDPLWSDSNIDMVSIDCYFPLTQDLPQTQIDYDAVYAGWSSGEGWDYFYNDSNLRTGKTNYTGATYAWKNVKGWWSTTHTNPNSSTTAWTAKMKPLWFTELGFPSVDGCSNQPNVFYDPTSIESFYPRASRGRIDFFAQRQALNASVDFLSDQNSIEPNLIPRKFIWTWDARPYPFWPDLKTVWADSANWKTGHWVNGKVGVSSLGRIIALLCYKVGLADDMIDVTRLTDSVDGFLITNRQTVRASLEQLASAYFFDCVESDGMMKFVKRGGVPALTLNASELIPAENTSDAITINRIQELDLPREVDVVYLNRTQDYQAGTQVSRRQVTHAVDYSTVNLPIVLSDQQAKVVADVTLYNSWVQRVSYQCTLPPKYALLEPTDIITVNNSGASYTMRITSTKLTRNCAQEINAVAEDTSSYDFYTPPGENQTGISLPPSISATKIEFLDIPAFPTDNITDSYLRYGTVGLSNSWAGSAVYRSDDGGSNYSLMQLLTAGSTIGATLDNIPAGNIYTWDDTTTIDVLLVFGELQSVTDLAVLNGANSCVIGSEIIQFVNATLLDTNKYRLSRLLRGRLGSEWAVPGHTAGERFVLLSGSIAREAMSTSTFNISKPYKPVTVGSTLANTDPVNFTYHAVALKPYAPTHITGMRDGTGNLTINWKRRTRIGGDWRDNVDVPISEESEKYEVDIMSGSTVKRTITSLTSATATYTAAQQVTDFGYNQSSVTVNIYQISGIVGRGYAGNAII